MGDSEKPVYLISELVEDLRKLGVQRGDLLNVKCSFKAIGRKIENGPAGLVSALIEAVGDEGTIVTDSFIKVYPLHGRAIYANPSTPTTPSYAGALANAMLAHPKVVRSNHPVQKFAAIGKYAETLMTNHRRGIYAYDPLRAMSYAGGKNLKIGSDDKVPGVGTTHVAIGMLGFRQRRPRIGVIVPGDPAGETFELDWASLCSKGLANFLPEYRKGSAILHEGRIGEAESKISDMRKTLEIELNLMRSQPKYFMCQDSACLGCQATWEFSPMRPIRFMTRMAVRGKAKATAQALRFILSPSRFDPVEPPVFADYPGLPAR